MTRFVFLSDTHIGTTPIEFQQQPAYSERMADILDALNAWIERDGNIDFILHGGDMLNEVAPDHIRRAAALFDRFSTPVYLCLGNHDLTEPDALSWWLEEVPQFFPEGQPNFVIDHDGARICVMPNQWDSPPWLWTDVQRPHFAPDQLAWLESVSADTSAPATRMFVTHSPVLAVPQDQTGLSEPLHTPQASFRDEVQGLVASWPTLQCVVGAHSHITTCTEHDGMRYVTSSAFAEAPFEFKLFEIDADTVRMTTHSLANDVDFHWRYDFGKTWVQGRPCDRQFRSTRDEDSALQHS
ncbi:MAG TPA: metallophosphoesterase [Thermomicrobiales bacterium]|nr:metallophosphoesterase [Thermomicrobiales bacterium]